MATTQGDVTSSAIANRVKIETGRGTLHGMSDPRNQPGLELVSQAVGQQLVEEAGYVKVRNTGTAEIIFMHTYWMPGEVRILHPGDFENVQKLHKDNDKVSFEEVPSSVNMAEAHDTHVEQVAAVMGNYFIGEKQAATLDLNLVPPSEKELESERLAADKRDKAIEDRALRDAKKPETKTDSAQSAQRTEAEIVAEKERSAAAPTAKQDVTVNKKA